MRLSPDQLRTITTLIQREFDAETRIWLFGSRADDNPLARIVTARGNAKSPCAL